MGEILYAFIKDIIMKAGDTVSIAALTEMINSLKTARDIIADLRQRFKSDVLKPDKKLQNEDYYWKGEKYTDFMDIYMEDVLDSNQRYYDDLGALISDMDDRLAELRAQLAAARRRARKKKKEEEK